MPEVGAADCRGVGGGGAPFALMKRVGTHFPWIQKDDSFREVILETLNISLWQGKMGFCWATRWFFLLLCMVCAEGREQHTHTGPLHSDLT